VDRDQYLLKLRDRRARFAGVLEELGLSLQRAADLRKQVGGGWTLGEHLVHIAAWERRYGRVVARRPRVGPSDWQKFNDAVYAEWRGVSPQAARNEYASAHRALLRAIRAVPASGDPTRPGLFDGWDLSAVLSHYREHATILLLHAGRPKPPAWRGRVKP
jgi:hypothetical protein